MKNGADVFQPAKDVSCSVSRKYIFFVKKEDSNFVSLKQTKDTVFHYCAREGSLSVLKEILSHLHSGQIQLAVNKQVSRK